MKSIGKYFRRSLSESRRCYKYCNELPLKVFFNICDTGDLRKLVIKGSWLEDELYEIWEAIIQEYGKLDGNMAITTAFEKSGEIVRNMAEYVEVMGMLMYLQEIGVRMEYVERLKQLGYNVTLSSDYLESIYKSGRKAKGTITRINILRGELEGIKEEGTRSSFDQAISNLSAALQVWVPDDITVSRYVELKKVVNERNKAAGRNRG